VEKFFVDPQGPDSFDGTHDLDVEEAANVNFLIRRSDLGRRGLSEISRKSGVDSKQRFKKLLGENPHFLIVDEEEDSQRRMFVSQDLKQWGDVYINIWHRESARVVPVQIANVIDMFSKVQRHRIISWLCHILTKIKHEIKMPGKYFRYGCIAGCNTRSLTEEEREVVQQNRDAFTTGDLYKSRKAPKLEYNPDMLRDANWFAMYEPSLTNDCLVHAVNFALKCPFFVKREQVIRLMVRNLKRTEEQANNTKVLKGVPAEAFKNILVYEGEAWSLEKLTEFSTIVSSTSTSIQGVGAVKEYILEGLLSHQLYREIILVGVAQGNSFPYTHAKTFVRMGDRFYFCDSQVKDVYWYPTVPHGHSGSLFNFNYHLNNYQIFQLYHIKRSKVNADMAAKISNKMTYVMTGVEPDRTVAHTAALKKSIKKRKSKGWRNGGR
jgi:hypothetical protein